MNAGQMIAQMPVGAPQPRAMQASPSTSSSPTGSQETSVFAGVLRSVSPRESARPARAAGASKIGHKADPVTDATVDDAVQPETRPDSMATTTSVPGIGVLAEVPSEGKTGKELQEVRNVIMCLDVTLPQNVALNAAESQIGAQQQINGRMPEAEQKIAGNGSESTPAGKIDVQSPISATAPLTTAVTQDSSTSITTGSTGNPVAAAPEKAVNGITEAVRQNIAILSDKAEQKTAPEPRMVVSVVQHGTLEKASAMQQSVPTSTDTQNASRSSTNTDTQYTVSDRNSALNTQTSDVTAQTKLRSEVQPLRANTMLTSPPPASPRVMAEASIISQPVSGSAEVRIVSGIEAAQNVPAETASETEISTISTALPEIPGAELASNQTEKSVPVSSPRPNLDAYFQTSVRPVTTAVADTTTQAVQTTAALPVVDAPADEHPVTAAGQRPVRAEAQPQANLMAAQEQPVVRQGSMEHVAKTEETTANSMVGSAKETATTTNGEEFGKSGNGFADQRMTDQVHLALSRQVTLDNAVPATGTPAVATRETFRTDQAEQIVSQVKDHLAGREIKPGTEQIVIRLSPENLGELKMNLRMENQHLKVEIVAETSMARDALMKHSDSLKETLARQNITMESFDVSTDSNKHGSASQGRNDWRELARQQQNNAWAPAGGYKLGAVQEIPIRPMYQASTAHSMVDVHF